MRVAVIDADLIDRDKHRFPNIACEKISGYHKGLGDEVELVTDYDMGLLNYDLVYISKVFTDTEVPGEVLAMKNVKYGGTGFFYDKAPPLPHKIEHYKPDYSLYDQWINEMIANGEDPENFVYYQHYSIGKLTDGCIRGCSFCVNKNVRRILEHSPLGEFLDSNRKYICLLDDNFLGHQDWKRMLKELQDTGKKFVFKQGLDIRLLTDEKALVLAESDYKGDYIFAFDDIKDRDLIIEKLSLWRSYTDKRTKLYVFCGYKEDGKYTTEFWVNDLVDLFKRIFILAEYDCIPYIMRHKDYLKSPFVKIYNEIAGWCNQNWTIRTLSFRQFCIGRSMGRRYKQYKGQPERYLNDGFKKGTAWKTMENFEQQYVHAAGWFDKKYSDYVMQAAQ